MAYLRINFTRRFSLRGFESFPEWTPFTTWEIETPYSHRICGVKGCKRLLGHPEPQVSRNLHADYDVTKEQPGTFSQWPTKAAYLGSRPEWYTKDPWMIDPDRPW